jgi:hypothetical protein
MDRLVLADPILRPTREPPLLNLEIQQRPGHLPRAMFDRYSIASTKDIEAALLKATLPAGNPVGQKRNPVETR